MADSKNQWNNSEYSEDNVYEENYYSDESENEEYNTGENQEYDEDYEEYDEDYMPQGNTGTQKRKSPAILIILLLVLLGAGVFAVVTKFGVGSKIVSENNPAPIVAEKSMPVDTNVGGGNETDEFFNNQNSESTDMMSVDFNENGETNVASGENSDVVATVTEANNQGGDLFENQGSENETTENNPIMVSYNKITRLNPFKPPVVQEEKADKNVPSYASVGNVPFEIIEPPTSSVPDANLTKLLSTQISGIMYDETSPSAIVNINGTDQFVKVGDNIGGYKIQAITKNKVQIKYQNNSYVASVGQLFEKGSLEQNDVTDLEHKFAGRYKNQ
ncbi:MAG: hypothetical protein LUG16_04610 [Candidatus Gastranaerophilales bacterium]|nr:hypothetical protein [Candidatus Gastranaerophilales bacterium]